ncbi:MAG: tetratricopeptide repeat protein [Candidatus Thorarchaeota archaeon]
MALETEQPTTKKQISQQQLLIIITAIVIVGGLLYAALAGWGIVPGDPLGIIGLVMLVLSIVFLGAACLFIGRLTSKMPEYGEMENKYNEAMTYYDAGDWEEALTIFKDLMGTEMDHKRALYYAARCCENLERWEEVKTYIKRYLTLQPKDREAWELLAKAHKKFFEYEEAEAAQERAENLPPRGK